MKKLFLFLFMCISTLSLNAQNIGIKSNLLYDMTTTINLGVEFSVSSQISIDIPFNYNPWSWKNGKRLKNLGVQPELRYWFCQKFSGHFIGIHAHYSIFNIGNLPYNFLGDNIKKNRYEGYLYGGGISYGYQWALSKRWGLELTAGVGYARVEYKKYPCGNCGSIIKESYKNYFGPTKIGLNLIYIIK